MAAQKGRLLLLKTGTGGGATTVAGLRTTSMTLNNQMVDVTTKDNAPYRTLLEDGGIRSMTISGGGVFTDAASEETIRGYAVANTINAMTLAFPNGDKFEGSFQITSYERAGAHDGEETYALTLESSGQVTFTAA